MSYPLQVGITGGIGAGKSTVAAIFSCLGVPVYDADSHAKNVMTTDGILIAQIKKEFGNLTYDSRGNVDRNFLAGQVFGFPERLEKLNSLVHPKVAEDYRQWVSAQKHPYVLKEAALLYESGSYRQLDKIITVTAPEGLRIKRVMNRDHRTMQEVQSIIERQWPEKRRVDMADYIIANNEESAVIPQVLKIHRVFLELSVRK